MRLASSRSRWLGAAGAESSSAGDASARRKEQDDSVALSGQPPTTPDPEPKRPRGVSPVDLAVGASAPGFGGVGGGARGEVGPGAGSTSCAPRPACRGSCTRPACSPHWSEWVPMGGQSLERELSRRLDTMVPLILAEVLRRARLTDMVLTYVNLDTIVAEVDLDAAAARLSVDDVARRLDIEAVLDRVDIDGVARRLEAGGPGLTLREVVLERVDIDAGHGPGGWTSRRFWTGWTSPRSFWSGWTWMRS